MTHFREVVFVFDDTVDYGYDIEAPDLFADMPVGVSS